MLNLSHLNPQSVFKYFEEICAIPRGSENMKGIADYCMAFAEKNSLKAVRDTANNVVIFKNASRGYENSQTVILQGHLDMVCQKEDGHPKNFLTEGIDAFCIDGFVKAKGTSLGADNGIAVAIIMAILADDTIPHPPIEAVFTTDEEIGLIGATMLDASILSGKKLINIDSEEEDVLTVSCAGGSDFKVCFDLKRKNVSGQKIHLVLSGLKGGHSGVEIGNGRVNANILAGRLLNRIGDICEIEIIDINGGNKANVIPNRCELTLCVNDAERFIKETTQYLEIIKSEISHREEGFCYTISKIESGEYEVFDTECKNRLIYTLTCVPDGVMQMSAEIEGLVETSLNLGILSCDTNQLNLAFSLRSNKKSSLLFLEERLNTFFSIFPCQITTSGHYPPWEFKPNSELRQLYCETYKEYFCRDIKIQAIHAGLECGVLSAKIKDLDCISIGPDIYNVHTTGEKLSISSVENIYNVILKVLQKMK